MLPRCSEVVSFAEMGATPTVVGEPRCTCAQCGTFQEPQVDQAVLVLTVLMHEGQPILDKSSSGAGCRSPSNQLVSAMLSCLSPRQRQRAEKGCRQEPVHAGQLL